MIEYLESSLKLSEQLNRLSETFDLTKINSIFNFSDAIMKIYNQEQLKLPHHLNILEAASVNENTHSKILSGILRQHYDDEYTVLDSFLDTFINQKSEHNLKTVKPHIQFNSDLIDIQIRDLDYALIIENKIYDAVDQAAQIARYIDKIRHYGFDSERIFIIYLTRDGTKTMSDYSWIKDSTNYKELFEERYFSLSFREDILPWLKEKILPNCRLRDVFLISALEQYIDYLEGTFNKRILNQDMNTEIKNHIKTLLNLNSTQEENLLIIKNKLNELIKTQDQLAEVKKSIEIECFNKWLEDIERSFPELEKIDKSLDTSFPKIGLRINFKGKRFSLLIENDGKNIYYGIGRHLASNELDPEAAEFLKPLLQGFKSSQWWYGYRFSSYNEIYLLYKDLVNRTLERLNSFKQ